MILGGWVFILFWTKLDSSCREIGLDESLISKSNNSHEPPSSLSLSYHTAQHHQKVREREPQKICKVSLALQVSFPCLLSPLHPSTSPANWLFNYSGITWLILINRRDFSDKKINLLSKIFHERKNPVFITTHRPTEKQGGGSSSRESCWLFYSSRLSRLFPDCYLFTLCPWWLVGDAGKIFALFPLLRFFLFFSQKIRCLVVEHLRKLRSFTCLQIYTRKPRWGVIHSTHSYCMHTVLASPGGSSSAASVLLCADSFAPWNRQQGCNVSN